MNTEKDWPLDCFGKVIPQINNGFMPGQAFAKVIGPGVIKEVNRQQESQISEKTKALINWMLAVFWENKKYFVILMLLSIFLADKNLKLFSLFCIFSFLVSAITTSVCFPPLDRYWFPSMPWVLVGSLIALAGLGQRLGSFLFPYRFGAGSRKKI